MKEKFICPKCNLEIKTNRERHVISCNGFGPRRLKQRRPGGMHWANGKTFIELYGKEKAEFIINKTKKSLTGKKFQYKSDETKLHHQKCARENILKRYNNGWQPKCGRCKKINYYSNIAGDIKVDGSWELLMARYLDFLNIKWLRNKRRFEYINLQNKKASYCPDFYLCDFDTYIEVKGYETDLDKLKWKSFPYQLLIFKKYEIQLIQKIMNKVG